MWTQVPALCGAGTRIGKYLESQLGRRGLLGQAGGERGLVDPSVDPSAGGGPVGGPGTLRPSAGAGTRAVETGGGLGVVAFVATKLSSLKGL